jgi:CTP-dependent riboflavin kinase
MNKESLNKIYEHSQQLKNQLLREVAEIKEHLSYIEKELIKHKSIIEISNKEKIRTKEEYKSYLKTISKKNKY